MAMLSTAAYAFAPSLVPAGTSAPAIQMTISDKAGMESLANKLNPLVGFWDPLNIVDGAISPTEADLPATLGWFRHAEIKHGRVAMAAFVGFCVQSNGIYFPWALTKPGPWFDESITFAQISAAGTPGDQWDALPTAAKLQIIGAVGLLEVIGEFSQAIEANGEKHYVKGGKPGYYPPFDGFFNKYFVHPLPLNLWDPFGLTKKMSPERKEKALLAEINNGRLAMIGIMGMLSASKGLIVPGLDSIPIAKYAGEYMAPLSSASMATLYGS